MRPTLKRQLSKLPFARKKKTAAHGARTIGAPGDAWMSQLTTQGLDPIDFLKELVAIDSMTSNIKGVQNVQERLAERLKHLGFSISWKKNPRGPGVSADLLIATLPPENTKDPIQWINFISHADTVLGLEHLGPFSVSDDGRTGRGSGVIDNKGGLVVAFLGLELFLRETKGKKERRFGLRIIISPNEEGGSLGFTEGFRAFAKDAVMALGFEPALDNGSIVSSRRGNRWYDIRVKGIEAHAGRSRGEHVNAAHELAIKIAKLHRLNAPAKDIAVNIGRIDGGHDRYNVICGFADAKLDTRFSTFQTRDRLHKKIAEILSEQTVFNRDRSACSEVSYEIVDDCPPFASTSKSRAMVREYVRIITEIEGQPIEAEKAGGAGDVNYMSDRSVVVIDGLGPIGGRMHTEEEFIHLPSLACRAIALNRFLHLVEEKF